MAREGSFPANKEQEIFRPLANFPPTIWGSSLASRSLLSPEIEMNTKEIETLKEEVKDMLVASAKDLTTNIEIINLLDRLGISYYFEDEIKEQVFHISHATNLEDIDHYDLHTVALTFHISRKYGHKISCDVFNKFKDTDGNFTKIITNDVRGILSLYEATFLKIHGEEILDEALAFARPRLEFLAKESSPHLARHIKKALTMPFHRGMPRLEAREYISFYEEEDCSNKTLLKFAKLDFNRVQLLHQQELASVSGWWKDLEIAESFPYSRDRVVEAYLAACGVHFEPEFSLSRILIAKFIQLVALVDDTYDSHGTLEELECLTAAFESCTIEAIDQLPADNVKILYKAFLGFLDEMEKHASKDGRSYAFNHTKKRFKELVRSYLVEARWYNEKNLPSFESYMETALTSCTFAFATAIDYLGMQKYAGLKQIEWLQTDPKLVQSSRVFGRLINDIVSRKDEEKEGHSQAWKCYMKEYGVSKEKAMEELRKMCDKAWEDMNEEILKLKDFMPKPLLMTSINLGRMMEVIYGQYEEGFTYALHSKDVVKLLFLEQVAV